MYKYRKTLANSPDRRHPSVLVNMTDTDSSGDPGTPCGLFFSRALQSGRSCRREADCGVEGRYQRARLELMVLHLPGSMSIMALITLSKESISLFSFLLHAPRRRHRRKQKKKAALMRSVCVSQTPLSAPSQTRTK